MQGTFRQEPPLRQSVHQLFPQHVSGQRLQCIQSGYHPAPLVAASHQQAQICSDQVGVSWAARIYQNQQIIESIYLRLRLFIGGDIRAGNGNATVQRVHIVNDSDSCSTVHEAQTLSSSSKSGDSEPVSGSSSEKEKAPEEVKHVKKPRDHKRRHKDTQKLLNLFRQTSTVDDQRAGDHNSVTLEDIKQLFHKPLRKAAAKLGMSKTAFKEICRRVGLRRWPYRMLMQADHDDSKEKKMEEERRRARRRRRRAKREKAEARREREMDAEAREIE